MSSSTIYLYLLLAQAGGVPDPVSSISTIASLGGWGLAITMLFVFGWFILRQQKRMEKLEGERLTDLKEANQKLMDMTLGLQSTLQTQEALLKQVLDLRAGK